MTTAHGSLPRTCPAKTPPMDLASTDGTQTTPLFSGSAYGLNFYRNFQL